MRPDDVYYFRRSSGPPLDLVHLVQSFARGGVVDAYVVFFLFAFFPLQARRAYVP